jgi:putative ABC transport system permease protein
MNLAKLVVRNVSRNRLRTFLTILGVTIAVMAFGFLRTVISAYYQGVEAAAKDRLVTRNLVSLVVPLPIAYHAKIERVPGVTRVATANWFGGIYKEEKNFFAKFAIEAEPFLDLYPEYMLSPDERKAFVADRTGCVVGEKLAQKFGFKIGDIVPIKGDIYYGDWKFTVRGIYRGRDKSTDSTQMFFHWKYLDEALPTDRQGKAGLFFIGISDPQRSPEIARAIDAEFKGSPAETRTESEKAFQQSFISMVSAILGAIQIVSIFVLIIVALILWNTIAMGVRERSSEIAILKALGFSGSSLGGVVVAESAIVGALGGLTGVALALPMIRMFGQFIEANLGSWFPVFELEPKTIVAMLLLSAAMGLLAAVFPAARTAHLSVVAAFRRIG